MEIDPWFIEFQSQIKANFQDFSETFFQYSRTVNMVQVVCNGINVLVWTRIYIWKQEIVLCHYLQIVPFTHFQDFVHSSIVFRELLLLLPCTFLVSSPTCDPSYNTSQDSYHWLLCFQDDFIGNIGHINKLSGTSFSTFITFSQSNKYHNIISKYAEITEFMKCPNDCSIWASEKGLNFWWLLPISGCIACMLCSPNLTHVIRTEWHRVLMGHTAVTVRAFRPYGPFLSRPLHIQYWTNQK